MSDPTSRRSNKRRRKPSNQFLEQRGGGGGDYRGSSYQTEGLQQDIEELQQDLVSLDFKEESTERKVELLSAIICKQSSLMSNMKDNITELTRRSLQNEFVILNKVESPANEDLLKVVKEILNSFGVTQDIDFEDMYRRGPPRNSPDDSPRPIIVRLHRRDIVNKILTIAIKRNPKNRSNPKIVPHLPEQLRQARAKLGLIAHQKYIKDNKVIHGVVS
jgi:hypothetical protein